jgi:formylglycine-generating enzyme required for sulfatase activity
MINFKVVTSNLFRVFFMLIVGLMIFGCKGGEDKEARTKDIVNKKVLEGMVLVPAGEFMMGTDEVDKETLQQRFGMSKTPFLNEQPKHNVKLGDYYIDKYEITNRKYKQFIDETGNALPYGWNNGTYAPGNDEHSVIFVSWFDADAYCRWAGKRLPTEAEWEKAARGNDGRKFPWGDKFDINKVNASGKYGGVMPVGHFKEDVSPHGIYDMSGNVSEWTSNWYLPYPDNEYEDKHYGEKYKVTRGGGWGGIGHYSFDFFYRTSFRNNMEPEKSYNDLGFRCALSR